MVKAPTQRPLALGQGGIGPDQVASPERLQLNVRSQAASLIASIAVYTHDGAEAKAYGGECRLHVGDGAVGLMGVLAARQMGADRIIVMSRHKTRQALALEYGATDIVSERGEAGVARIKELTKNVGAVSVLECVGLPS
jgi:threonine dehydrogenase-like Zn-dependent dehydrogenase